MSKHEFQTSKELRLFFNSHVEAWRQRTDLNLRDLADRCGVSPSYLSQIGRYGRVPGRPVLILLALNFELTDPTEILRIAGSTDEWPYPLRTVLRRDRGEDQSFLSVRLDMPALTESIRTIIRDEVREQRGPQLLANRPIRIGLNPMQPWMYLPGTIKSAPEGFFHAFCRYMGVALQRPVETKLVRFNEYREQMAAGEIDMYGPVMSPPAPSRGILYTAPIMQVGVCAVMRMRAGDDLETVKPPKSFDELKSDHYRIAVLRDALPHLIANTRLGRHDSTLVLCESDEEASDRLLLRGIRDAAHVFLCNGLMAHRLKSEHPKDVQLLFAEPGEFIDFEDATLAVSQAWRETFPVINQTVQFLLERGGFHARLQELFDEKASRYIQFPLHANSQSSRRLLEPAGNF